MVELSPAGLCQAMIMRCYLFNRFDVGVGRAVLAFHG